MSLDAATLADNLQISRAAAELYLSSDVIDLHVDTFIWARLFGYDLLQRHGYGPFDARYWGSADVPRACDALTGAIWVITTNPLRTRRGKRDAFFANLAELSRTLSAHPSVAVVKSASEYRA